MLPEVNRLLLCLSEESVLHEGNIASLCQLFYSERQISDTLGNDKNQAWTAYFETTCAVRGTTAVS